jgi:hypothetical protein
MLQARSFAAGLKLNGSDKRLQQAFWDAIALISQTKRVGEDTVDMEAGGIVRATDNEATLMSFPAAAAALLVDV